MSRELDEQCARALGYEPQMRYCEYDHDKGVWCETQGRIEHHHPRTFAEQIALYLKEEDGEMRLCAPLGAIWEVVPEYSSDRTAALELEDEIERRGLIAQGRYALFLMNIISRGRNLDLFQLHWHLIRATPEQRARAFLAAISENDGAGDDQP